MDASSSGSYATAADSDEEEVMETRVVGVTERGVLRKRSVKRKMTKEEKSKLRGYGNSKSDYDAIVARIMEQKMVRDSVDTLRERLKMVTFMYDDCMELVAQWDSLRDKQHKRQQAFDLELLALVSVVVVILGAWIFTRYLW